MHKRKIFKSYGKTSDTKGAKFCIWSLLKRNLNINFTADAESY